MLPTLSLTSKLVPTLKSNLKAGINLNDGTNLEVDTSFEAGIHLKLVPTRITYKEMFTLDTQSVITMLLLLSPKLLSYCTWVWDFMRLYVTVRDFMGPKGLYGI